MARECPNKCGPLTETKNSRNAVTLKCPVCKFWGSESAKKKDASGSTGNGDTGKPETKTQVQETPKEEPKPAVKTIAVVAGKGTSLASFIGKHIPKLL